MTDVDHAFMNFSFLSEKWLAQFLSNYKSQYPERWTPVREEQLQDEIRHTNMIYAVMVKQGAQPIEDLQYSIQEAVYKKLGLFDMGQAKEGLAFECVQHILERRASILYKIYLLRGNNPAYQKVIRQILKDEERHIALDQTAKTAKDVFSIYAKIDSRLFSAISSVYGEAGNLRSSVMKPDFWKDLFAGNLVAAVHSFSSKTFQ